MSVLKLHWVLFCSQRVRKRSQWGAYHSLLPLHAVTRSHLSGGWRSSLDRTLSFKWHLSFLTHKIFYKSLVLFTYSLLMVLDSRHKSFCYEIMQVRIIIYLHVFLSLHPSLPPAHVDEVTRVKWEGTFHSPWTDKRQCQMLFLPCWRQSLSVLQRLTSYYSRLTSPQASRDSPASASLNHTQQDRNVFLALQCPCIWLHEAEAST